jgi:hypothetical protein
MSRRAVLKIAAAAPAVLGLGAGLNTAALALSPALASEATGLKIPANTRLRGVNIVPTFAAVIPADQHSVWSAMWRVWNWNGWIKPQIDDAAAIGNAIRFFGNTHCIAQGNITQATYLAQWRQVLDYSVAKGLFIYPCGGDLGHWGNFTWSQSVALYTAWANMLSTYSNVVGVDITNEACGQMHPANVSPTTYNQPESYVDLLAALGGIVRSEAGVRIAHSFPLADSSWWTLSTAPIPTLFEMSDFLDYHIYASTTPAQAAQAFTNSWGFGKHMVIGEFGVNETISSNARTTRYQEISNIVASRTDIDGALAWSCWDLTMGSCPDCRTGLYDASRRLRTDISTPFATIPVTRAISTGHS